MWDLILGLLSSGSSILYGLLAAGAAVMGALILGRSQGKREERDRIRIESLEEKYETVEARRRTEGHVRGLSDAELDRLQLQYELDESEPTGDVRRVGSDSSDQSRSSDQSSSKRADRGS